MKNENTTTNETVKREIDSPQAVKEEKKDGASTYAGKLFGMIIYPEAMEKIGWTQQDLITYIQSFEPKKWYARIHDKDVWTKEEENEHKAKWEKEHGGKPLLPADIEQWEAHKAGRLKKPHYHVVMQFMRPRKIQPIRDSLSADQLGTVSGLYFWRKEIRYLCHLDSKHKEHYSTDGVFGYSNHYEDDCQPEKDVQEMEMDIMSMILPDGGIHNYGLLMRWAREQGYQYVKFIRAHTSHFNNMCKGMAEYKKELDSKNGGLSAGKPRQQSATAASLATQDLEGSQQAQQAQQADYQQQAQQQAFTMQRRALATTGQSTYAEPPRSKFDPSKPRTAVEVMGVRPFANREAVNAVNDADLAFIKHRFTELEQFAQYANTDYNDYSKAVRLGGCPQNEIEIMRKVCGRHAIKFQNMVNDLNALIFNLSLSDGQKKSISAELSALQMDYSPILVAARRGDFDN